jgi:hypothetical protein
VAPWILLALLGLAAPSPVAAGDAEVHAVWLSYPWWRLPSAQKKILASYLAEKGVNRVYLSVYDEGRMRWVGTALARAGYADPGDDAALLESVRILRARGIEPAAFFEWGLAVSQEAPAVRERPDLFQRCGTGVASGEHGGRLMAFLDPSQDEAMAPVLGALEELARHPAGFREIQLDRFRYTHVDWRTCTAQDGTSSPAHVARAVAASYRRVRTANPAVTVSASPVGSYGFWKHNQRWGEWVRDGSIDAIATQAYITPVDKAACRRGAGPSPGLAQTVAIFKGELASLSGQPDLLEEAVAELKAAGGDERLLELDDRRPMVKARQADLAAAPRRVPIVVGYAAHRPDEAGCVVEEMRLARKLGFPDAALWVSAVAPSEDGSPNPAIADDLELLGRTGWR